MFRSSTPMLSYGPRRPSSTQRVRRPKTACDESWPPKRSSDESRIDVTGLTEGMASQPPLSSRSRSRRTMQPRLKAGRFVGLCPTESALKTATSNFVPSEDPFAASLKELPKATCSVVQALMQPSGECDEFGVVMKRALADHYYIGTDSSTRGPRPTKKTMHMKALASLAQSDGRISRESTVLSSRLTHAQTDSQGIPKLEGTDGPLCFARRANNVELFTQSPAKTKYVQFACFDETREDVPTPATGAKHGLERSPRAESALPDIAVRDSTFADSLVTSSWRGNTAVESSNWVGDSSASGKASVRFPSRGSEKRPASRPESVPNPGRILSAKSSAL